MFHVCRQGINEEQCVCRIFFRVGGCRGQVEPIEEYRYGNKSNNNIQGKSAQCLAYRTAFVLGCHGF